MYWVFSFIAEEKSLGFQPIVSNRREASRAWWVPNSGSSCLPAMGAGQKLESCETSFALRMQTKRPWHRVRSRRPVVGERLDQGRDVVRVAGDDLEEPVLARRSSASSLIPMA